MAAVDPDIALRLAKAMADLYGDAAAQMLATVSRRLANGIDQPGWAEAKLLEIVKLRGEAQALVERLQNSGPDVMVGTLTEAATIGGQAAASELGVSFVGTNTAAVEALARETLTNVQGTHLRILRFADDAYRQAIAETAAPDVVAGVASRREAAQRALSRLARQGVTGFVDSAGRGWELESYVEMATRTASGNALVQGSLDVYQAEGRDLVIISDAPAECRLCRPFEGRVFSISGRTHGYPRLLDARDAGLFHANCRHRASPYIPGLTRRMEHTADPEGDQLRQRQRALERRVRAAKRQVAAVSELADPNDPGSVAAVKRAKGTLAKAQADLKAHVDDNDLKRLRYREQIGSMR